MVSRKVRLPVNAKYPLEESDFDPVREAPGSPFRLDYVQALERFMDSVRQANPSSRNTMKATCTR